MDGAHCPGFGLVRITAYYRDGKIASTMLRVQLHPGWG
jgi:hypothetical protein